MRIKKSKENDQLVIKTMDFVLLSSSLLPNSQISALEIKYVFSYQGHEIA
jgi:hypothetical protein